ncbi:hypothetical protein EQM13_15415 [Acidilutibacter cellobiosedens]|jgi:hypothetical protein|uniref:Uncharacterized protein n=1 Tax=Acidilutibacter cellobiosedens TaxID=2507161 RepID=A0A410QG89_9FIRM|nr:hypothetical protein [Acidilutibacter cellobiosedens]QAT62858.1 hypothetical protein EQM13_15415 [Acidilutibacter cellobiosedens]
MEKLPPIEKIYEAYSAIADNRVTLMKESAAVLSSNREKEYTVTWENGVYTSNDNASYWRGYAGYPIIAVLMLQKKLSLNSDIIDYFKGINWTELNKKYKAKYSEAVEEVMDNLNRKNVNVSKIKEEVEKVYEEIKALNIICRRSSARPPK